MKDPKLRAYWREQTKAARDVDIRLKREQLGRGYWPVKIVPWLAGVPVGLYLFLGSIPAPGWFDLVTYAVFSTFFGAVAGTIVRVLLIEIVVRLRQRNTR